MSDEWIVQFGGVFVELEVREKRKELGNLSPQNDLLHQNPSCKSSLK